MKKIKWKKNFKPDHVLQKIDNAKNISEDGRLSFGSFEYHDAFAAIFSMIDFPPVVKEELNVDSVVSKALGKAALEGTITKETMLNKLQEVIKSELATREVRYVLLSSLSIDGDLPIKRATIGKTSIRLETDYPIKYSSREEDIRAVNLKLESSHQGYTKVIATTKAKSSHAAANKALRDIDTLRAVMCLFTNTSMELFGVSTKPINNIRLGQAHTLHFSSGASATKGTVWYDESFIQAQPPFRPPVNKFLSTNIRWVLKGLSNCHYGETLKDSLVRFAAALDEANQTTAITKLWGAVECLAAPSEANYDAVVKRCSFLFEEYQYHRQVLEHLREYRNQSIHAGSDSNRAKTYCFQLQFYYRELILFHLHNYHDFDSLDQANAFLDLPTDTATLLAKQTLIKKAVRFRHIEDENA
ncbi:hypothetical protein [Marinobacterium stanieri]|uniref:hypothetical protein n=1 Tax=Marinobacterium stanieri TaxID=49186 RepID=UPI000255781B|nr:hypothetical protein [Marinobacterium stanieri]